MSDDQPTTEELRAVQLDRAADEHRAEQTAEDETERRAHERRAERAAYLADKLDEQAEAHDR